MILRKAAERASRLTWLISRFAPLNAEDFPDSAHSQAPQATFPTGLFVRGLVATCTNKARKIWGRRVQRWRARAVSERRWQAKSGTQQNQTQGSRI